MNENKISISIPKAVYEEALQKLNEVQSILSPYLIALSNEERRAMPKMGDKTFPFVEKAIEYAVNKPGLNPGFIDLAEWEKDSAAHKQVNNLLRISEQLCSNMDDTSMLCGSEAYTAALGFYNNVRQAVKMNVADVKPIYEDLSERFPGRRFKRSDQQVP